jgi:hypothetical protein
MAVKVTRRRSATRSEKAMGDDPQNPWIVFNHPRNPAGFCAWGLGMCWVVSPKSVCWYDLSNGDSAIMVLSSEVRDPLPFSKGCLPAGYKKYSTQNTARMQKGWDRKHVYHCQNVGLLSFCWWWECMKICQSISMGASEGFFLKPRIWMWGIPSDWCDHGRCNLYLLNSMDCSDCSSVKRKFQILQLSEMKCGWAFRTIF